MHLVLQCILVALIEDTLEFALISIYLACLVITLEE